MVIDRSITDYNPNGRAGHPNLPRNGAVIKIDRTTLLVPGQLLSTSHPSARPWTTKRERLFGTLLAGSWIPETLNDRFVLKFE
jgi:hypothetical protein